MCARASTTLSLHDSGKSTGTLGNSQPNQPVVFVGAGVAGSEVSMGAVKGSTSASTALPGSGFLSFSRCVYSTHSSAVAMGAQPCHLSTFARAVDAGNAFNLRASAIQSSCVRAPNAISTRNQFSPLPALCRFAS